ncbi:polyamine deacetylase HDAC10 [Rhinatrema bivittatum]|uniref:polyamine deacetylase HDAC10 n=1 Tax=Rhinatrema bivittatum TaxID=194408 RepID=UPI00112AF497|nr:polyamine deacetylase HDAC10 [Rhinatrema bivittatum]XP_029473255.1 polyamine deacetylase HDAC10 [Rhinatrema bivittatum]
MASGTALLYDKEMSNYKLLWDDPACAIDVPERLVSSYERLKHYGLLERCVRVPVREATVEEILLIHSKEYLEVVQSTQFMNEEELWKTSQNYDCAFFHPNSYRCARLAAGATLQLVDSVVCGRVRNGMALVRPPGHHSQRNVSNGFCVFNNVAIAAEYARRKHGLQRVLIVDWDIHHGQGIQYAFEEDPSILYFSWHRYEHQEFWPNLKESNYDAVGKGEGTGFNVNVPWNKIGMGNADYIAVFLHVLLPMALEFNPELIIVSAGYDSGIGDPEGRMCATPDCFSHLTHLLMQLAEGKLCVVLEGGYHMRMLSESVCMTVKTLLGDPVPQLYGEMTPCLSAIESIQNVIAAHAPFWNCFMYDKLTTVEEPSTKRESGDACPVPQTVPYPEACTDEAKKADVFLQCHMTELLLSVPPVRTAAVLPPQSLLRGVQVEASTVAVEETEALISNSGVMLVKEEAMLLSLGKTLSLLTKILNKQIRNGIALSPAASLSSVVAVKQSITLGFQKVLCIAFGDVDLGKDFSDDGKTMLLKIGGKQNSEMSISKYHISLSWIEDPPEESSFVFAVLRFILPLAYSYQPDIVFITLGAERSISVKGISLLACFLQGLAEGQTLAVIQDSEAELAEAMAEALTAISVPHFASGTPATTEAVLAIKQERQRLQQQWKLLQCSVN